MRHYIILAIAVIGLIGVIDESHAQTILVISEPNPESADTGSFDISSQRDTKTAYVTATNETRFAGTNNQTGYIYYPDDTDMEENPIFPTAETDCEVIVDLVSNLLTNNYVTGLALPNNVVPKTASNSAIGLDVYHYTSGRSDQCVMDLEVNGTKPLLMTNEMLIKLNGKHDKKAYYWSPRDNITVAQPIPLCTTTNFDTSDNTIKGETKMCYGKNGNDMIIVSKRPLGFYGAANNVTVPTPAQTPDNTPDPPANSGNNGNNNGNSNNNNNNDIEEYTKLLKRLYLGPI